MSAHKRLGFGLISMAALMLVIGLVTWQARGQDGHIGPYGDPDPGFVTLNTTASIVDAFLTAKALTADTIVIAHFETSGGSRDMAVDGSSTPVVFSRIPASNKAFIVGRVLVYLSRNMGTSFNEDEFTNLTALANGVTLKCDGTEILTLRDNADFSTAFDSVTMIDKVGGGGNLTAILTFDDILDDASGLLCGDTLGISLTINDDLSTLSLFRAVVEAKRVNEQ